MAASPASARAPQDGAPASRGRAGTNGIRPGSPVPERALPTGACRAAGVVLSTGARPLKQGCREAAIKKDTLTPRPSRRTRLNRPLSVVEEEGRTNVSSSEAAETIRSGGIQPLQPPSVARPRTAAGLVIFPRGIRLTAGAAARAVLRPPPSLSGHPLRRTRDATPKAGTSAKARNGASRTAQTPPGRESERSFQATPMAGHRGQHVLGGGRVQTTPAAAGQPRAVLTKTAFHATLPYPNILRIRPAAGLAAAERGASLRASPRLREAHTGKLRMAPMLIPKGSLTEAPTGKALLSFPRCPRPAARKPASTEGAAPMIDFSAFPRTEQDGKVASRPDRGLLKPSKAALPLRMLSSLPGPFPSARVALWSDRTGPGRKGDPQPQGRSQTPQRLPVPRCRAT